MGIRRSPDASLSYLIGTGYYRKRLTLPDQLQDKLVTLHVDGVRMQATIWLKHELVGNHKGYTIPFEFPLDDYITLVKMNW
jgi:beta-galactosidase/beta-glucuronidase